MKLRKKLMLFALCIMTLTPQGCLLFLAGAGAGATTAAYITGELRATDHVDMDRAWQATLDALTAMNMPIGEPRKDALTGRLVARTADNKDVNIRLDRKGSNLTEIRIRIGVMGDETRSRQILERIRSKY